LQYAYRCRRVIQFLSCFSLGPNKIRFQVSCPLLTGFGGTELTILSRVWRGIEIERRNSDAHQETRFGRRNSPHLLHRAPADFFSSRLHILPHGMHPRSHRVHDEVTNTHCRIQKTRHGTGCRFLTSTRHNTITSNEQILVSQTLEIILRLTAPTDLHQSFPECVRALRKTR